MLQATKRLLLMIIIINLVVKTASPGGVYTHRYRNQEISREMQGFSREIIIFISVIPIELASF